MIAKLMNGNLISVDVATQDEFLEHARKILKETENISDKDELKLVFLENEENYPLLIIIPFDREKELMKVVWKCYRHRVYINTDSYGKLDIFDDAFSFYRTHFDLDIVDPPEINISVESLKSEVWDKIYDFEQILLNAHPYSSAQISLEQLMHSFHEMYVAVERYEQA